MPITHYQALHTHICTCAQFVWCLPLLLLLLLPSVAQTLTWTVYCMPALLPGPCLSPPLPPPPPPPDRLVRACSELPKLCEFFHIPFQSGDDTILREMRRGYTAARYASIIDNIRRYMPDASISGDAIVGFPGQ